VDNYKVLFKISLVIDVSGGTLSPGTSRSGMKACA